MVSTTVYVVEIMYLLISPHAALNFVAQMHPNKQAMTSTATAPTVNTSATFDVSSEIHCGACSYMPVVFETKAVLENTAGNIVDEIPSADSVRLIFVALYEAVTAANKLAIVWLTIDVAAMVADFKCGIVVTCFFVSDEDGDDFETDSVTSFLVVVNSGLVVMLEGASAFSDISVNAVVCGVISIIGTLRLAVATAAIFVFSIDVVGISSVVDVVVIDCGICKFAVVEVNTGNVEYSFVVFEFCFVAASNLVTEVGIVGVGVEVFVVGLVICCVWTVVFDVF